MFNNSTYISSFMNPPNIGVELDRKVEVGEVVWKLDSGKHAMRAEVGQIFRMFIVFLMGF